MSDFSQFPKQLPQTLPRVILTTTLRGKYWQPYFKGEAESQRGKQEASPTVTQQVNSSTSLRYSSTKRAALTPLPSLLSCGLVSSLPVLRFFSLVSPPLLTCIFLLVDLFKTAVLQDRQVKGELLGLLEVLNQLFWVPLIALSGSVPVVQSSASPTLCVRERAGHVQQRTLLRAKGLLLGWGNLGNLPFVYVLWG